MYDAPAHAFRGRSSLKFWPVWEDKWLNRIFEKKKITKPVIIGQSWADMWDQVYAHFSDNWLVLFYRFRTVAKRYVTAVNFGFWRMERYMLTIRGFFENLHWGFDSDLWKKLMRERCGNDGIRSVMPNCRTGFRILAEAMEKNLPYGLRVLLVDCAHRIMLVHDTV